MEKYISSAIKNSLVGELDALWLESGNRDLSVKAGKRQMRIY